MRSKALFLTISAGMILPAIALAGVPDVREITVTDVTPSSFSVVWEVNEPATAGLKVFQSDCATMAGGAEIVSHPVDADSPGIRTAAENAGVMKVMVKNLSSDTLYCYQTVAVSKSTADTTVSPSAPASVRTMKDVTRTRVSGTDLLPFSNDLLKFPAYLSIPTAETLGMLLEAQVDGTGPVTAWFGDGIAAPLGLIDLINVFDTTSAITKDLTGGERVRFREWRGTGSCGIEHFRKVPADSALSRVLVPQAPFIPQDVDADDCITILDVLRVAGGFGQSQGDDCYNKDLDQDGNDTIEILDVLNAAGQFGVCTP